MKSTSILLVLGVLIALSACNYTREIYLSPEGNDEASGTAADPFMTPERARDEVRKISTGLKRGTINVILQNGIYEISGPLIFSVKDAFPEDICVVWKAADGAQPVISGAIQGSIGGSAGNKAYRIPYSESEEIFDL